MKISKSVVFIIIGAAIILTIGFSTLNHLKKDTAVKEPQGARGPGKSVDSLEKLNIGGIEQWIDIKGKDDTKPILLFLHGGPGYGMMPLLHMHNSELENHFVVVNWDQRGAALSYTPDIPKSSMTLKQFVSDLHDLTGLLKSRFKQEKIYIAAHSFGTVIGMKAISKYPNDYWAYVGIGQVVDIAENEQHSYDFAMESARKDNNNEAIEALKRVGRPDEEGNYTDDEGYNITTKWLEYYGGDLYGKNSTEELENEIYSSEVYSKLGKRAEKGFEFSQILFEDDEVSGLDFRKQLRKVKVPVYFFSGRHDYDTPFALVQQYYNLVNAPKKELVWFENSAHFPFYEEPEKFNGELINKILPETYEK
ncbi:MAG TPA: alpha/beta hydrolase [Clostridia bacterium]